MFVVTMILCISCCKVFYAATGWLLHARIAVSSAYVAVIKPGDFGRSAVYIVNRMGPKKDPCGTLAFILWKLEVELASFTWYSLSERYDLIQHVEAIW